MAKLYWLGAALILIAVLYQYRKEIQTLISNSSKTLDSSQSSSVKKNTNTRETSGGSDKKTQEPESANAKGAEESESGAKEKPSKTYYNPPFDPNNPPEPFYSKAGTRMITQNELAAHAHDGPLKPLWLAVMGRVFDVDKGAEHYYGPNGGYKFFTGRDGTRAFVTGEFNEEGLIDDIEGLTVLQLGELEDWVKFYDKDYTFVGKLIGRYNTKEGSPTKEWYKFMKGLGDKEKFKAEQRELEKQFPGCNSRWNEQEGGVVFCSEKSGGVHRDWVGFPVRFFNLGSSSWRCACVQEKDLNGPHVKPYPGCEEPNVSCKVDPKQLAELRASGG